MTEGDLNARLNDTRKECSGVALMTAAIRGEKTGSLRLPNLSTRPPIVRRRRSRMISSWR
jgi:hypothetical protein